MEKEAFPKIVSQDEWLKEHEKFLEKEKKLMKESDKLNAERRRLPMETFNKEYIFEGPNGKVTMLDLFEGRRQLLLYNFMLQPGQINGCDGCSMVVDNLPHLSHLNARNTTLALLSPAPLHEIEAYKKRMGWNVPWYSSFGTNFNEDTGVNKNFRMTVFIHDDEKIYRTYFTTDRGVETLGTVWALLDITPLGRQEKWENTPQGRTQTEPFQWWRRHDEY